MKANIPEVIEMIGLENVANVLKTTPEKLTVKVEHPEKFTLMDLTTLQRELGFTDKMIMCLLESKRERN